MLECELEWGARGEAISTSYTIHYWSSMRVIFGNRAAQSVLWLTRFNHCQLMTQWKKLRKTYRLSNCTFAPHFISSCRRRKKKRCISHQMTSMQYHVYPIHRSIQHESQCWEEIKMKWRQSGTWNASQIHWRKRTNSPNRGQLIRLCHVLFAISFELKCLICCLLSNETKKKSTILSTQQRSHEQAADIWSLFGDRPAHEHTSSSAIINILANYKSDQNQIDVHATKTVSNRHSFYRWNANDGILKWRFWRQTSFTRSCSSDMLDCWACACLLFYILTFLIHWRIFLFTK